MLKQGQIINGYIIQQYIGKGSYADVYKCIKMDTKQVLALKVFRQLKHNYPQNTIETVMKEVDLVQKLDHPNIVKCYGYFKDDKAKERLYAVFQYCGKGNLQEYMSKQRQQNERIPDHLALDCIYKILLALKYIHKQHKVAHRDIKLANILLDDECNIKLADFGLSKAFGQEDMTGTYCGTPLTMAPQIMARKKHTQKCDTWSFGVISYYILFCDYPFNGRTTEQLHKVIIKQRVPDFPPNVRVSEEAKDLIRKCLQIDPKKRPKIQQLQNHPWFTQITTSKFRKQYMKHSMGECSEIIQKANNAICLAVHNYIKKTITLTNLPQKKINILLKGLEEFYPERKEQLYLFLFFAIEKAHNLEKGEVHLFAGDQQFVLSNSKLNKLSQHNKHIIELLRPKIQFLNQTIGEKMKSKLTKSYKLLVKFVVQEGQKYVEQRQQINVKKLKFLKNLLNFLNTTVEQSTIKITLKNQQEIKPQAKEELESYIEHVLNQQKILNIINGQIDKSDPEQSFNFKQEIQSQWNIQIDNKIKTGEDNETWNMVGEIVERALAVKEIVDRDAELENQQKKVKQSKVQ